MPLSLLAASGALAAATVVIDDRTKPLTVYESLIHWWAGNSSAQWLSFEEFSTEWSFDDLRAQGGTWVSNITETSPLFEYKDQLKLLFLPAAPPSPPAPPCPPNMPGVELTISWAFFVAFFLLSIINTIFFPVTLYVAISGWMRGRKVDEVAKRSAPPPGKYPPVCALVPCFLPNEKGIIMGTLNHILTEITYPGELVVMVVYNTPESMPMEAELRALERETFDRGRRVRVMRVLESRSKAENLNEAIKVVPQPLVAIYDADHYPDPESLTLLVDKLQETGADAVQGSVYIRDLRHRSCAHSCLARYISAEFFCQFFIFFPMMEILSTTGVFGGSNALWRASVIRGYEFSTSMQTEDIDVSARAILDDHKISLCPEARSGELSPADLLTLYRQRLRWLIGWDQVTFSMMKALLSKRNFNLRKAIGLYLLFPLRWITISLSLFVACLTPVVSLFYVITDWGQVTEVEFYYAIATYWIIVLSAIIASLQHESRTQTLWVFIFYATGALYILWTFTLIIISLVKIFSGRVGAWHVTRRATGGGGGAANGHANGGAASGHADGGEAGFAQVLKERPSGGLRRSRSSERMRRVPSWLAFNPLSTFRFNQLDEPVEANRMPRESSYSQALNTLH